MNEIDLNQFDEGLIKYVLSNLRIKVESENVDENGVLNIVLSFSVQGDTHPYDVEEMEEVLNVISKSFDINKIIKETADKLEKLNTIEKQEFELINGV